MPKHTLKAAAFSASILFLLVSYLLPFEPGRQIGANLGSFFLEMVKLLPCAFILIGLFEVWVKKEAVEKHLGGAHGVPGYLWMILLAGTTVGGLYVAFPVAGALYRKGARLAYIFSYIGFSAVCRIPMTIFEASFLGLEFTLIRLLISIPLIIISSAVLAAFLEKRNFRILS